MPAPPLSPEMQTRIRETYARLGDMAATSRELGVSYGAVAKYCKAKVGQAVPVHRPMPGGYVRSDITPILPEPVPEAGGPTLPEPVLESYDPFSVDTPGKWLILSDVHLPHHDRRTVESAVEEARKFGVAGVLLNGDILDCGEVSDHDRMPTEPRLEDEIEIGGQFFRWLRNRLPGARILWKEGNHEARLPRFLARKAPALFSRITLPKLVDSENYGIEWIGDGRIVQLGKLPVVHGHEFKGGGGVNPARWLFLQAISTAMCGHFHRTSEHHETGFDRRTHGVWSLGCACFLWPRWYRNNKWNHGYAFCDVEPSGHFRVTNRRILRDGQVV